MILLELFSGAAIFSNYMNSLGFTAYSLDFNKKFSPTHCMNVLDFNYSLLPGPVHVLWASPDCSTFSRSAFSGHWDNKVLKYRKYSYVPVTDKAKSALHMVNKTFEIINYYSPGLWVVENPVGRFRHLDVVCRSVPYIYSVNYKDWGFDYSKETDLFTNFIFPLSTKVPLRQGKGVCSISGAFERSKVPVKLIKFLVDYYLNHSRSVLNSFNF